jgi:hypothetical protein
MKAAVIGFESNAAGPLRSLCAFTADSMRGVGYWRAAEEDEQDGLPFTAAQEWQRAAECFRWIAPIADRCWREWERIMHLPRNLSNPIEESEQVVLAYATEDNGANVSATESLVASAA